MRSKKNKNRSKKDSASASAQGPPVVDNFCLAAAPGCYIAHHEDAPWLLSTADFDPDEYDLLPSQIPEISVDPHELILSVINMSESETKVFYVSTAAPTANARGRALQQGWTRDDNGETRPCTTFIVVVPPMKIYDLCTLKIGRAAATNISQIDLDSDIQILRPTGDEAQRLPKEGHLWPKHTVLFPFPPEVGPLLCTQGFGGCLTHYFPETYHALDFKCPPGTPIIAVGSGLIQEIHNKNSVSGIRVSNLFKWNSLLLKMDSGLLAEYVHLKKDGFKVDVGQRVQQGQVIAESGDVGFCPEPHLHFQIHYSDDAKDPTAPFMFVTDGLARSKGHYQNHNQDHSQNHGHDQDHDHDQPHVKIQLDSDSFQIWLPKAGDWCSFSGVVDIGKTN